MFSNCPHEGKDHRFLGKIGCFVQSALSVKEGGPRYFFHDGEREKFVIAYPPYVAGAFRIGKKWIQFRLGVRFDSNWPGYIVPCISLKTVNEFVPF